jgi:hypothetical protein
VTTVAPISNEVLHVNHEEFYIASANVGGAGTLYAFPIQYSTHQILSAFILRVGPSTYLPMSSTTGTVIYGDAYHSDMWPLTNTVSAFYPSTYTANTINLYDGKGVLWPGSNYIVHLNYMSP